MAEIQVHTDKAEFVCDCVIIHARREMTDWRVREFCRRPILFRGQRYFVSETGPAEKPFARKYLLAPWQEDLHDASPHTIYYDEDYVRARDKRARGDSVDEQIHVALLCLAPFIGLLWSGTKRRLGRFGLNSRAVTGFSVFLTFDATLVFAILVGWLGGASLVNYGLLALLLADVCLRYDQLGRDTEDYWGFGEWLVAGLRRITGSR
ncbi:MAG: hypothetical protein HY043_08855 [Verrucomicrobia bacterium]|nr:hypothetical protein [Verrucomicrobiota bacterium]